MITIMFKGHCTRKQPDKSILYNTYYQWVSIFLMAQVLILIIWFGSLCFHVHSITHVQNLQSMCINPPHAQNSHNCQFIIMKIIISCSHLSCTRHLITIIIINAIVITIITISYMKAFLFYLPRMIWLSMEGGLMAFLCEGCSGLFSSSSTSSRQ